MVVCQFDGGNRWWSAALKADVLTLNQPGVFLFLAFGGFFACSE